MVVVLSGVAISLIGTTPLDIGITIACVCVCPDRCIRSFHVVSGCVGGRASVRCEQPLRADVRAGVDKAKMGPGRCNSYCDCLPLLLLVLLFCLASLRAQSISSSVSYTDALAL